MRFPLRGDKSEAESWTFLRSLWGRQELRGTVCCECREAIDIDKAFARTFSLVDKIRGKSPALPCAKEVEAPQVQRTIQIFHRHLECLYKTTPFVAISHVWGRPIAKLQHKRKQSDVSTVEVETLVRSLPAQIAVALEDGLPAGEKPFEIWHDYISVPQWSNKVKTAIILKISELIKRAKMTVVYLNDVDPSAFDAMRSGASKEERCRGIGQICDAEWYSRMWTTMEHTESANMMVLAKGFRPVAPDGFGRALIEELKDRWRDESRAHGSGRELEEIVWANKGLVPWTLGTIDSIRSGALAGRRPNFGHVHGDLSWRRVTVPKDFFYAFEGMLKTGYQLGTAIERNPKDVMHGMAMRAILSGDLSPLFMVPAHAKTGFHLGRGYVDHNTWGLDAEDKPHECTTIKPGTGPRQVVVSAEEVGVFWYARRFHWVGHTLGASIRMALDASGLDVDAYVDTHGVRLYGQNRDAIQMRLAQDGRRSQLREQLCQFYDNIEGPHNGPIVDRIADLIDLSNTSLGGAYGVAATPIGTLEYHGNTLHHGKAGAIVGMKCMKCQRIFLLRILLYQPISTLLGVKAYRIPGLKYRYSHAGGMGILLIRHKIVGRFVWGTPTCACPKMTEIEVAIDDLPMPRPNNSRYK
ncbi:hypothetical protein M409DRAFT_54268 [Zasmidium cellare ATCC 36951]|uniref:Heterokaryon incompatibility domain-containing protein n=1 Tax=Zasmidium cellare ATCC 36951 TaxID=1080233 RepID=A0A6A6CIL0_ZASCE|nr:uncharacterized protein M409DRAFT_54268 [Zasmidium cellare ATCC 36951]KAF2167054.1 hypothetical protein M409DRAFT_54268 [Zasmidium cellare ATCC 36951]